MAVGLGEEALAGASHSSGSEALARGGHYLAKCVLRGSAVLQAVQGHFRSPSSVDIVFGKETSLELVAVEEDGVVQSICEQSVFGIIKDLAILCWNKKICEPPHQTNGKDLLVVLSDSGKLSFLAFCSEMHRFFAVTHIDLSKPGNSLKQLGRMLAVDPNGTSVAVSAFEDQFAILSLSKSTGSNIVSEKVFYPPRDEDEGETTTTRDSLRKNIRGTIWSMCFIPNGFNPLSKEGVSTVLAIIMHRKGATVNDLVLFGCNFHSRKIRVISRYSEPGPLAFSISPIPNLAGFAFLFRIDDVLLMDLRDTHNVHRIQRLNLSLPGVFEERLSVEEPCRGLDVDDDGIFNVAACALLELRDSCDNMVNDDDPMCIDSGDGKAITPPKLVSSWTWEPGESAGSKMIFCLDTGEIFIIEIHSDVEGIKVSFSDCLYNGLACKSLLWVDGGFILGLVEMGDGMVLKLEHERLHYKSSIQNIAPILDLSVVDNNDEKQDQMFACCGMSPDGSLRIIRSGISVERLLRTAPIYQGITGTWTLRMKKNDTFHSFLVLSFVEETRVLSVGLSFGDVSDATGFLTDACTLACGLVADSLLVQIHKSGVRLCLPTIAAHPEGVPFSAPVCASWFSGNATISLGAVGHNLIIVATSNPCFLFILGVRLLSDFHYEIYEIQHFRLMHEVSCISIPQEHSKHESMLTGITDINMTFLIGTHKPSVEILSFVPEEGLKVVAIAVISINNAVGSPITGCIPEHVRLVVVDRAYVLSGLRNGMLLRFEWPSISAISNSELSIQSEFTATYSKKDCSSSTFTMQPYFGNVMDTAENSRPVILQLIAVRRIGITPVFLVPLHNSLDADMIILSDRPWLLHSVRHSLAYTSISFQPSTHVTPVCSMDCPTGILFVADNTLNLVEMVHSKRLNVQKFCIEGTPRKVLYHSESKTLLVIRCGLSDPLCSSDISRVDPLSGTFLSKFKCEPGETAKCMRIMKLGNEDVLVVGTSQCAGRTIMPSGEAESSARGRLIVLGLDSIQSSVECSSHMYSSYLSSSSQIASQYRELVPYPVEQLSSSSHCGSPEDAIGDGIKLEEMDATTLRFVYQTTLPGAVLAVCPYLDRYVLASAGNILNVFGFPSENFQRLRKLAIAKTRFTITCLTTHFSRIAVGDCRDGVLFFSYHEDVRKLEQLYSDPVQRLVADCALMDSATAVVSDRRGIISVLSCPHHLEEQNALPGNLGGFITGNESPEKNLVVNCSFYVGESVMSIQKGSFSYKLPADDIHNSCHGTEIVLESVCSNIVASTLLGSVLVLIPITSEEHELLEAVQARLVVHPLTSPILGNYHKEFRGRGSQGVPTILDGDMLAQFLELTTIQQEAVISAPGFWSTRASTSSSHRLISISQVVRLLERVYYAIN